MESEPASKEATAPISPFSFRWVGAPEAALPVVRTFLQDVSDQLHWAIDVGGVREVVFQQVLPPLHTVLSALRHIRAVPSISIDDLATHEGDLSRRAQELELVAMQIQTVVQGLKSKLDWAEDPRDSKTHLESMPPEAVAILVKKRYDQLHDRAEKYAHLNCKLWEDSQNLALEINRLEEAVEILRDGLKVEEECRRAMEMSVNEEMQRERARMASRETQFSEVQEQLRHTEKLVEEAKHTEARLGDELQSEKEARHSVVKERDNLAEFVRKLTTELDATRKELQAQAQRIRSVQQENEDLACANMELRAKNLSLGAEVQARIEDKKILRAEHGKVVANLEAAHGKAMKDLEAVHDQAVASLEAAHGKAVASLEAEHGKAAKDLEAAHGKVVANLEAEHSKVVANREAAHGKVVASLEAEHGKAVANLEAAHGKVVASLEAEQVKVANLEAENRALRLQLRLQTDRANTAQREKQEKDKECTHVRAMLAEAHAQYGRERVWHHKANLELTALREQAAGSERDASHETDLKLQIQELESSLANESLLRHKNKTEYEAARESMSARHAKEISTLKLDLDQLGQKLEDVMVQHQREICTKDADHLSTLTAAQKETEAALGKASRLEKTLQERCKRYEGQIRRQDADHAFKMATAQSEAREAQNAASHLRTELEQAKKAQKEASTLRKKLEELRKQSQADPKSIQTVSTPSTAGTKRHLPATNKSAVEENRPPNRDPENVMDGLLVGGRGSPYESPVIRDAGINLICEDSAFSGTQTSNPSRKRGHTDLEPATPTLSNAKRPHLQNHTQKATATIEIVPSYVTPAPSPLTSPAGKPDPPHEHPVSVPQHVTPMWQRPEPVHASAHATKASADLTPQLRPGSRNGMEKEALVRPEVQRQYQSRPPEFTPSPQLPMRGAGEGSVSPRTIHPLMPPTWADLRVPTTSMRTLLPKPIRLRPWTPPPE
ncbi:hypothetical protein CLCR_07985 [Cladophialophora carrionii]|uniref:Uncharacterized protein n=1 Tax=Cladophialophora carrionii TaxID=86049 RepID=A0A1C1CR94_9EURO|nr:hypothetical protein CLCR_07985 [Cladophialophora carrionii]